MQRRKGDEVGPDYAAQRRQTAPQRDPRRVLLIDGSRVDRLLVSTALALKGRAEVRITEVTNFDLGLSLLLQRPYDLVLVDDALPDQSPWETTRAIRGVAPTIPIIRHGQYLERRGDENGLDALVEAVDAALATRVRPSSASGSWLAASAAS